MSDYGTDVDGDGLYDYLTVEMNVASDVRVGDATFDGYLYDESGNLVAFADAAAFVDSTPSVVQLNFPGQLIYATIMSGLCGKTSRSSKRRPGLICPAASNAEQFTADAL